MTTVLYIISALLAAFLLIILVRAAMFRPEQMPEAAREEVDIDPDKTVNDLREMIRCRTVSYTDESLEDKSQFDAFKELLKKLYPSVNGHAELSYPSRTGVLYRIRGKSGSKHAAVFMAHYDVVPADEGSWEKPAFEGVIEDGVLWGRGTLDTKVTLCGTMEAAEYLLSNGFMPENDIYLAFSGEEEIAGPTASDIAKSLKEDGVEIDFVIDEGGAVVEGVFPGVEGPCALVGISEKGIMDAEFLLKSSGGHASAPPAHTIVGEMAMAICNIENNPFKMQITKAVSEMFDTLGRRSTFLYRIVFANVWCFKGVLDRICRKGGGELNALVRTTAAFTMTKGSLASNVLPNEATAVANLRLCGEDTAESALAYLRGKTGNDRIEVRMLHGTDPSHVSLTEGPAWEKLCRAISQTWSDAVISPYMMIAASDSRYYSLISDKVYRFSCMALSKEERGLIHGNNERIPLQKITETAKFYVRLMKQF